jgi:hypothetical protein
MTLNLEIEFESYLKGKNEIINNLILELKELKEKKQKIDIDKLILSLKYKRDKRLKWRS